jgi:hypothetical protein
LCVYINVPLSFAQKPTKPQSSKSTSTGNVGTPAPTTPTTVTPKADQTASGLTNAVLQQVPTAGADYIPCKFTYNELQSLVSPERKLTLSPADAERLVQSVVTEVENQQSSGLLDARTAQALLAGLNSPEFVGLTPTQAISLIIRTVQVVRDTARVQNDLSAATNAAAAAASSSATAKDRKDAAQTAKSLALDARLAADEANDNVRLGQRPDRPLPEWIGLEAMNASKSADEVGDQAKAADLAAKASTTSSPNLYGFLFGGSSTASKPASPAEKSDAVTSAAGQIVNQAQTAVNALMRPIDVGCAMSVLSWDESKRAYGRIIANTYIAVQVVVRNLSRDQQFMLHDAEYAVNIDPGGKTGRFFSGRDKVIVRSMAAAQESFDIRNLVVHTAEGVGAILSATALVYGGPVGDASSVYVSGFFPSLSKAWKDTSTDQLNLLNDTGFSSTSSSQVVVPKSGTVMFVTFIPSKQFEQAWWALPCASRTFIGQVVDANHRELIPLQPNEKVAGDENVAATGYDVEHALASCRIDPGKQNHWTYNPGSLLSKHASSSSPVDRVTTETPDTNAHPQTESMFLQGTRVPYSKWSGNALAIFQELSTAVVAGMHILDESALQSSILQLNCDTDSETGKIKFPLSDKGQLSCNASGKNLDKVKSLRLRNAHDPADPSTADGNLNLSGGDNSAASVIFSTDTLHKLNGADYTVMSVDKTGLETKTSLAVHLDTSPFVSSTQPTSIDISDATSTPNSVVLNGFHLAKVIGLTVKTSAGSVDLKLAASPVSSDTVLNFDASKVDWSKLGTNSLAAQLVLKLVDGISQSVTQSLAYVPAPAAKVLPSTKVKKTKPASAKPPAATVTPAPASDVPLTNPVPPT